MSGQSIQGAVAIHQVLWPDAELESVEIDYDCVTIVVRESTGQTKRIKCLGHIGYECLGIWDEAIIETATLSSVDSLIDCCIELIERRPGGLEAASGNPERNRRRWNLLSIIFIDGSELKVVAAGLSVEMAR